MANQEHFDILMQGVEVWNTWREEHPGICPNLSRANLSGMVLIGKNTFYSCSAESSITDTIRYLSKVRGYRSKNHTKGINLSDTNLEWVNFRGTNLKQADLSGADLSGADLSGADLYYADLAHANLFATNLENADLGRTNLIEANLEEAKLVRCFVYGISAWDTQLKNTVQSELIINRPWQPRITVDNLEVAQFIYLLLNNQKIRDVINTITSKVVLILGRFTDERKLILDALRDKLRKHNYSPVVFDFEKPSSRNLTETISTLAHLSRFIIADLTDAKSIPHELERIIPRLHVPVQSLLHVSEKEVYTMYKDFEEYHWVLPIHRYSDLDTLLRSLHEYIIDPAEQKAQELEKRK